MKKEKEQKDKLNAVKARLIYGEESHYSESKTPTARIEPRRRHGDRYSRSPSPHADVFKRLKKNRSPSPQPRPRKEGGVFNRLGRKEPATSACSDSRRRICDKKNKVLFTDTDCLVLSEEFQLPDESQVVLRIPREHDLYTFHISDLQPEQKEIKRDYSNPRTPQQNGVAERKNRTLIEAARTMLADSKLPTMFWTEAVCTACYVLNRVSITNRHIISTPYELGYCEGKAEEGIPAFKQTTPAGTQDIIIPADYAEELAKLQRQEDSAGIGSAGGVSAGSTSAGSDPAGSIPAGHFQPADSYAPAASTSVSADLIPVHADESTLPPGQVLGSSENTTRFPVPSDVCKEQISSGNLTSSSYDDDCVHSSYLAPVCCDKETRAHKSKFGEMLSLVDIQINKGPIIQIITIIVLSLIKVLSLWRIEEKCMSLSLKDLKNPTPQSMFYRDGQSSCMDVISPRAWKSNQEVVNLMAEMLIFTRQCKKQTYCGYSSTEAEYVCYASIMQKIHTEENVADLTDQGILMAQDFEYQVGSYLGCESLTYLTEFLRDLRESILLAGSLSFLAEHWFSLLVSTNGDLPVAYPFFLLNDWFLPVVQMVQLLSLPADALFFAWYYGLCSDSVLPLNRLLGEGKRFRGLHRHPQLFDHSPLKTMPLVSAQMLWEHTHEPSCELLTAHEHIGCFPMSVEAARETTPERAALRQNGTVIFEEPISVLALSLEPAGYVDPDSIDPIIFGPQPRPYDFVDPALEEPVIFGPLPRPATYIEPEDIDNLISMEDDTILGGFHEESPAGPDDAPTPTVRVWGVYIQLENRDCFGHDQATVPSEDIEKKETRRGEVPLGVLPQAEILLNLRCPSVGADNGKKLPCLILRIPAEFLAEDAQARQRLEEEQASARLVQQLQAEDLAQADVPIVSEQRATELDELMLRMTETDCYVNEDNFIEAHDVQLRNGRTSLADLRYRAPQGLVNTMDEVTKASEIPLSGCSINSGAGVVDRKHRGVRSDDSLWAKPVEDFFSSESVWGTSGGMVQSILSVPSILDDQWKNFLENTNECVVKAARNLVSQELLFRLDLTNGKLCYIVCGQGLTVLPSTCRDVVVGWKMLFSENQFKLGLTRNPMMSLRGGPLCSYLAKEGLVDGLPLKVENHFNSQYLKHCSSSIPADYVSAGHVLVSADRDRIC
ncbi:putative ribonuclease H-like domain-containing protein [Tanacetum coccineum]